MKTLFISILAFFVFSFFSSSFPQKNGLDEMNLFGKVRSVTTTEFDAFTDSSGVMVKEKKSQSLVNSGYIQFNEKGNKVLELWFNSENAVDIKDTLIYDTLNRLSELKRTKANGTKYKTFYFYDSKNNMSEMIKYRSNGTVFLKRVFFYDQKNNLIEQKEIDEKGKLAENIFFKRDLIKNTMEQTSTLSSSGAITKNTFRYDAKGKIIEKQSYAADKKPDEEMLIKYNGRNDETEIDRFDSHGILIEKYFYKYTFDQSANWISCIIYCNDKLIAIKERKIEYFP